MDLDLLERRLLAAVAPHDLLAHPYYQAWSRGELTPADLRAYAGQYRHQIDALPRFLGIALEASGDAIARAALRQNLDEEQGREPQGAIAHRELWLRFAEGIGALREDVLFEEPHEETAEAAESLRALIAEGELPALAGLWAYERQAANVSRTKLTGLVERYGVTDRRALSFFAVHKELDLQHAADLLAAVARACAGAGDAAAVEARVEEACRSAARAARAQGRFLDGVEGRRTPRA